MASYGKSRSTSAPPAVVWNAWSDPANWPTWNSGIASVDLPGGLVAGSSGSMVTKQGGKHPITIESVEPGRSFTMSSAVLPLSTFVFACEIAPAGTGSTISQSVTMRGPLAFLFGPLMGNQIASNFVPVLDDLAAHVDAVT